MLFMLRHIPRAGVIQGNKSTVNNANTAKHFRFSRCVNKCEYFKTTVILIITIVNASDRTFLMIPNLYNLESINLF